MNSGSNWGDSVSPPSCAATAETTAAAKEIVKTIEARMTSRIQIIYDAYRVAPGLHKEFHHSQEADDSYGKQLRTCVCNGHKHCSACQAVSDGEVVAPTTPWDYAEPEFPADWPPATACTAS